MPHATRRSDRIALEFCPSGPRRLRIGPVPEALERHVQTFLAHLRLGRRLAKNTELAYGRDLGRFVGFCESRSIRQAASITSEMVREFVQVESENGLGPRSLRRRISSIRAFF